MADTEEHLNRLPFSRGGGFSLSAAGFIRCDYQVRNGPTRVILGDDNVKNM